MGCILSREVICAECQPQNANNPCDYRKLITNFKIGNTSIIHNFITDSILYFREKGTKGIIGITGIKLNENGTFTMIGTIEINDQYVPCSDSYYDAFDLQKVLDKLFVTDNYEIMTEGQFKSLFSQINDI